MGGGGAMKAAAKVAGIGVANSVRGFAPDHPVCAAARMAVRQVSVFAGSSASDDAKGLMLPVSAVDGTSVQMPCSEFDDWEFPDAEEGPPPRLVFSGAPTLQEAKEATSDLKEAIENVFLSPTNKFGGSRATGADLFSNSNDVETKSCVNAETAVIKSLAPTNAFQAFMLLCESSAAQNVVASIACDPNVHSAVMVNPELQKFLTTFKSGPCHPGEHNVGVEESVGENEAPYQAASKSVDEPAHTGSGFADFFKNMKVAVVDMINSLSGYLENIFSEGYNVVASGDGSAKVSGVDKAIGASFMGLAVMVIMVVLLKRA
ncbi:unnamed protein product [Cuscuta europaea]|uniref:Uncharacterized protein n=1 Tax=Cuscuta europaea TaxID=41803 RepID=A0A9P0Z1Q8_CUSEU|nr:unnamed protein product [Cuscuta europaea]